MGDTALMIATFNNDLETVKYIVEEEKFDVNCRDNRGYTPFIGACANNFIDLVIYFRFVAKADVEIRGFDNQSAAHRAAFYGHFEILTLLDKYTTLRTNQPDKRGNLPVHYAAMNNHFNVVRYLLGFDAKSDKEDRKNKDESCDKKNKAGKTAEMIIRENLEKIKILKNPNSTVSMEEVRKYIMNPNSKPFMLESKGNAGDRDGRKNTFIKAQTVKLENSRDSDHNKDNSIQEKESSQSRISDSYADQVEEKTNFKLRRPTAKMN